MKLFVSGLARSSSAKCEVCEKGSMHAKTHGRAACLLVAVVHRHKSKGGIKMVVLAINQLCVRRKKSALAGCGAALHGVNACAVTA